jgi:hypothetical protein
LILLAFCCNAAKIPDIKVIKNKFYSIDSI